MERILCIGARPVQLLLWPAQGLGPALAWGRCRVGMPMRRRGQAPHRARGQAVELAPWLWLMCCLGRWWMLSQLSDLGTARLPADMTGHIEPSLHVINDKHNACRWSGNRMYANMQVLSKCGMTSLAHGVAGSSSACGVESASAINNGIGLTALSHRARNAAHLAAAPVGHGVVHRIAQHAGKPQAHRHAVRASICVPVHA